MTSYRFVISTISLSIALAGVVGAVSQQLSGSITGTVVDARTQAPVSGITVVVRDGDQTTTNAAGQFRLSNVRPGRSVVQAVRSGWATLLPDGSPASVAVKPGEVVRDLRLQIAPFGVISGRIRRSDGEPASGVLVQAFVVHYREGQRVLVSPSQAAGVINASTETDSDGAYHLNLPPGLYYVCGQYRASSVADDQATARALSESVRMYYPGTSDVALAGTVRLSGGEAPGIDFKVDPTAGDLHMVYVRLDGRGTALNTGVAGVQIAELRDRISQQRIPIVASLRRGNSRSTELVIDGVPNGSFDLFVDGVMEGGVRGRGVTTIDVRGQDLHEVVVNLQPPQDIPGRVSNATASRALSLAGVTVQLGTRRATVDANGGFLVPQVPRGFHSVSVEGLPPDAYVADIRYGGISLHEAARSLNGPELESGIASTPMEILVVADGGVVDGMVEGRETAGATVALVPSPSRRFVQSYYKTAIVGPGGEFSIRGVPPGVYELFAWDSVPETAWLNPQFLSRWEGRGQTIPIEAGRTVTAHPRLLHQE